MIFHLITLGILFFEFVVFIIQWFLFRKREFVHFSIFCLSIALHYYLVIELKIGWSSFCIDYPAWDVFFRRELGLLGCLMYIRFAKFFIDDEINYPKLTSKIRFLENLVIINIAWQAIAVFLLKDEKLLEHNFAICFILIFGYGTKVSIGLLRKRIVLFNFIMAGSFAATLGCFFLIGSLAFNFTLFDGQIFLDIGLVVNIFLLNIGLIYKFNYLNQKQVEDQNKLIQSLKEREAIVQKLLQVRERISADIHDDVLGGLSSIRISSDLIRSTTPSLNKVSAKKISEIAQETAQRLNVIIWSLNHENDDLTTCISYIKTFAFNFFEHHNIAFSFQDKTSLGHSSFINGNIRKNMFFTIKEALEIIVEYNHATKANICIESQNGMLHLTIKNNGLDLSKQHLFNTKFKNMEKRMRDIGGQLDFSFDKTIISFRQDTENNL